MLDCSEGCENLNICGNGQAEWVLGQCLTTYGPTYELVTCVSGSSEGCSCTFVVNTSAGYTTHSSIINCYAYGMFNSSEGCENLNICGNGQAEWVLSKGLTTYGPAYKLITSISSSCKSCGCTFVVYTCAFYCTHSRIVSGDGNGMLYHSEVCYGGNITSYGQCQWVLSKGFTTYGPVNKLMTCCWCSGQGCCCTFGVSTCTFYCTHSWIVSSNGNGMLYHSEVCYGSNITSYGQCQWVIGEGFATYGPVNKLMTCCWSSGQGCGCTFVVNTSAFYTTHSRVVSGDGHSMLNCCESCKNCFVSIH